ncbi:metallophosphoesterase [Paenibacillus glycanilyticus]|uniref:metallophosphoesterase family protein n=1 Tax=Paenibacillus glycanilyticus TaxID=126569 RepID=UPI002040DF3F|nr:metallophosphoesterase [Paenibacillus glycanilyticus]MCM3625804.1 metallophosphoesterase [Paenibacillus glycanilyticus]
MKIVVVSDTHMPRMAKALPPRLLAELENADLILHAGDWTSSAVYSELRKFAPVKGVAGNNDGETIVKKLGYKKIVTAGGKRIGLVHGHLPSSGKKAEQNAALAFTANQVDAIVFGHSHIPFMKEHNGILLFNPGSATARRKQPQYSFGIMSIIEGELKARHIFYDNKI